jgi:malonyl-CoA/methylmalonyl-CoA synthetase
LLASCDPAATAALQAHPPAVDAHATCLMIYTSGTTGRPKGAELTHGNLSANLDALHTAWGWREDDLLLHVLPIFHVHGLLVALQGALHAGAATILHARFDPVQTLRTLHERRCSVFMAVPTIHRRLVDAPHAAQYDLSHMRLLTSGSDRLPDDLFVQFQQTFGHTLLERYGMSETIMLLSNPLHGERRVGSVGLPLPGVEVRIVDPEDETPLDAGAVGEVQVRGSNVCKGYWRQPDKTAAAFTPDGWFRTGDLGLREPDGYYTLKGRSKDLIICGGYNVYPPEVELVLAEHPAVLASAVIGCPDAEWGERVAAVVVVQPGLAVTAEELIEFCRGRLAHYKAPRTVRFAADLPRNAMGKVQKVDLRRELCSAGNRTGWLALDQEEKENASKRNED